MGGTTADLHDVVALAESGRIRIDIDRFGFAEVVTAYARIQAGDVRGRAVVELN
jgi:propanol-preferring alcohol dehydrogenase